MELPPSPPVAPLPAATDAVIYPRPIGSEILLARIGTGAFTSVNIGVAVFLIWFELRLSSVTSLVVVLAGLLIPLVLVSGIFGYVTLCLWMQAARARLVEARYDVPPAWQIWIPWFIPIWNLFGPRKVMESLHVRVKWGSSTFLNVWWLGWVGFLILDRVAGVPTVMGSTFIIAVAASTALLVMSYGALQKVITDISASVAEPVRAVPRAPRS